MKLILKYINFQYINPGFLRIICFAIFIAIILAGLWPFNFFPKNKVKWLENKNGISFFGQGVVISQVGLQETNKLLFPDRSISLELWLKPLNEPGSLPHIVNLYDYKLPGLIAVGQWRSHLIIQSRTNDPSQFKRGEPYRERGLSNALLKNRNVFITIISDEKETAVYVNGVSARVYPGFQLLSEYKGEPLYVIIGNSPIGYSFWNGELMGLAIYKKALKPEQISANYQSWMQGNKALLKQNSELVCFYPFDERKGNIIHNNAGSDYNLIIPEVFKPVHRIYLDSSWPENKLDLSFIKDVTINLLGFIPFGLFVSAFLVKTKPYKLKIIYFAVVIAGFTLSLSIEFIQAFLSTRFSQLIDLVLNTSGTAIGVFVFNFIYRIGERDSL